ncbi:MAG: hypothetical protein U0271_04855 [Polyangiaceae bacterium]
MTVALTTSATPATSSASASLSPSQAPPCPIRQAAQEGLPPWQGEDAFDKCIRSAEGRWLVTPDKTDPDGYRHTLAFDGARGERWTLAVDAPLALARRLDGGVIVVDLKNHVTLVSNAGAVVWKTEHPKCGMLESLAVDYSGNAIWSCGYSLLRVDANGHFAWQKWPFRDHHMGSVWVDRGGLVYTSGDGVVIALSPEGEERWRFATGFNRAIGKLVWTAQANLVFDTSMAELHSDTDSAGYSFYYDVEPNELFEISRGGALVTRAKREGSAPPQWPVVLPVPEDGSHRLPF